MNPSQRRAVAAHRAAFLAAFTDNIEVTALICKRQPVLPFCQLYEAVYEHDTAYKQVTWSAARRYERN